jgi:hypothetical protein
MAFTVVEEETMIGAEYASPVVADGVVPSMV